MHFGWRRSWLLAGVAAIALIGVSVGSYLTYRGSRLSQATSQIGPAQPLKACQEGGKKRCARASLAGPAPTGSAVAPGAGATELSISIAHPDLVVFSLPSIDDHGAMGVNQGTYHDLGFQRSFGDRLIHGLMGQDYGEVSLAISAVEYSFAHQNSDGSFQVVQIPGASYQLNTHNVVGVSFFYADLGHALGLLQDSSWFSNDPQTAPLRARLEALRPRIQLSLNWLSSPGQQGQVQGTGRKDTNRWTFGAEAYLLVGQWLGDQSAIGIGEGLLKNLEGNLQPDGTLLEKGGFDSGYQGVSLNNLFHIYLHLGSGQESLKPNLWSTLSQGVGKERQSVLPSGQITHIGNTRTYCGGEVFRGKPKEGGGHDAGRAFTYMSALSGDGSYLALAESIKAYYSRNSHSLCATNT